MPFENQGIFASRTLASNRDFELSRRSDGFFDTSRGAQIAAAFLQPY